MSQELRQYNQAPELYLQSITAAYRREVIRHPSLWLARDPESESKMLRDADIGHAVSRRCALIAGRHWNLTSRKVTVPGPKGADPRGDLAVAVGTELLNGIKHFAEARKLTARAFFHGQRYSQIHLKPRRLAIGDGTERTWRVPIKLEDQDQFRYRKVQKDPYAKVPKAHWERWDILGEKSGQWVKVSSREAVRLISHVYNDDEASLGYGRGLREALGWPWYAKTHVGQETIGAVERFARGWIHAKVSGARHAGTGLPNTAVVSEWLKKLEAMQTRHVLVSDKDDELKLITGSMEGWQMLTDFRKELKNTILTLVLSANLPTSADKGGSFALASTQESSEESLIQFDREALEETYSDDLVGCIWYENQANLVELGIEDYRPWFNIHQEKREDPTTTATVASTLHNMGVPLDAEDIYERTGNIKPKKDAEVIPGAVAVSSDPFGDLGGPLSAFPQAERGNGSPSQDLQETALNGAQVTAASEIIKDVVNDVMPPGTAKRMLVSMFNLDPKEAAAMVNEAVVFVPATPVVVPPAPPKSTAVDMDALLS